MSEIAGSMINSSCEDSLQNYDIHHEIGRGSTCVVYLATCRRGRMRNRGVVLKKITERHGGDSPSLLQLRLSTPLHQSLLHPCIVSLLSTFSTNSAQYHVMEFCPNGTLHDLLQSRHPPVLSEPELRGVLKSLVSALTYLHKRLVIHRDIKPRNILLGENCGLKLSDFGLAIQVDSPTSTVNTFCGSPNYVSPEIVEDSPYSFATDLWSLGCLAVTCLSGNPAFEAPETAQIFAKIPRNEYVLPDTVSYEARDLVSGLLQTNPAHRTPLHRILSHPFFNPSLSVLPLSLAPSSRSNSEFNPPPKHVDKRLTPSFSSKFKGPLTNIADKVDYERSFDIRKPVPIPSGHMKATIMAGRRVFSDSTAHSRFEACPNSTRTRSVSNYSTLRQEDAEIAAYRAGRRLLTTRTESGTSSAVSGLITPALTTDYALSDSDSGSSGSGSASLDEDDTIEVCCTKPPILMTHREEAYAFSKRQDQFLSTHPLLLPPKQKPSVQAYTPEKDSIPSHPSPAPSAQEASHPTDNNSNTPRGAGLTPLNTAYLSPKMHKLTNGNVTVLPSKALLVDFREGERRKGRKGDRVLVISSDGGTTKVYDAPHLSMPCCLAEPVAQYLLQDLPDAFTRQYTDAARVVDKLKQRIPKLVLHDDDAQCTLMVNEPIGDIEIMLPAPTNAEKTPVSALAPGSDSRLDRTTTRVRLLRNHRTVEISRSVPGVQGKGKATGEWTRKVIPTLGHGYQVKIPDEEADLLDDKDTKCLARLYQFLKICEAVEMVGSPGNDLLPTRHSSGQRLWSEQAQSLDTGPMAGRPCRTANEDVRDPVACPPTSGFETTSVTTPSDATRPLSSLRVTPRPPKFSLTSITSGSNLADAGDSRRTWFIDESVSTSKQ